jgi:hypothetical protein
MPQSANNDWLIGLIGVASIPLIIAFIIFIIWLIFGIGTLTRLTDIKYLLDDIKVALENNNTSDVSSEVADETPANIPVAIEPEEPIEEKPSILANVANELIDLKKPSKVFIWILGTTAVVFIALMVVAFFLNR